MLGTPFDKLGRTVCPTTIKALLKAGVARAAKAVPTDADKIPQIDCDVSLATTVS